VIGFLHWRVYEPIESDLKGFLLACSFTIWLDYGGLARLFWLAWYLGITSAPKRSKAL